MVEWIKDPALPLLWLGGHCCGAGSIPGPGISTYHRHGKKKLMNQCNFNHCHLMLVCHSSVPFDRILAAIQPW